MHPEFDGTKRRFVAGLVVLGGLAVSQSQGLRVGLSEAIGMA